MFFADYHLHTSFSSDSKSNMSTMVENAIKLGLSEIAFTDHIDIEYPDPEFSFLFDYDNYKKEIDRLRQLHHGKINILCGVELGLQGYCKDKTEETVIKNDYDFIIGSSHCVNRIDLSRKTFFKGKTKKESYQEYFEDVLNNVTVYNKFNVYGHIDYINRYGIYEDNSFTYDGFSEILDEILRVIISKNKGIEINTSGFRYGLGYAHPKQKILKRYKELGGEIITVGSDAHRPEDIANNFKSAYDMLISCGFKYITRFIDKKPHFLSLDFYR